MAKRYNFTEVHRLSNRQIFFDTNILIYLFWPTNSRWEKDYSALYKQLLHQKNEMIVDFIIISELVNRLIRIEYEKYLHLNSHIPFKSFRDSRDGQEALNDIYVLIKRQIIEKFSISGKEFTKSEVESFLHNDGLDFSDKGILAICKDNNYVLFTNDKDFAAVDLEILTNNPELLATS